MADTTGHSHPFSSDTACLTRAQAMEVLRELDTLLYSEFPFETDADRMVAHMAAITALLRGAMKQAYMFVYTALTRGSGKTLLASIPALVASGTPPAIIPAKADEETH